MFHKTLMPRVNDFAEYPELAVLMTLATNLEIALFALNAAYPDLDFDYTQRSSYTEQDAYLAALGAQLRALQIVLEEYLESLQRIRYLKAPSGGGGVA